LFQITVHVDEDHDCRDAPFPIYPFHHRGTLMRHIHIDRLGLAEQQIHSKSKVAAIVWFAVTSLNLHLFFFILLSSSLLFSPDSRESITLMKVDAGSPEVVPEEASLRILSAALFFNMEGRGARRDNRY